MHLIYNTLDTQSLDDIEITNPVIAYYYASNGVNKINITTVTDLTADEITTTNNNHVRLLNVETPIRNQELRFLNRLNVDTFWRNMPLALWLQLYKGWCMKTARALATRLNLDFDDCLDEIHYFLVTNSHK